MELVENGAEMQNQAAWLNSMKAWHLCAAFQKNLRTAVHFGKELISWGFPFFFCDMIRSAFKIGKVIWINIIFKIFEYLYKNDRLTPHIWFAFSTKMTLIY